MFRSLVAIGVMVACWGCRSPNSSPDPFLPWMHTRVPPPATGAVDTPPYSSLDRELPRPSRRADGFGSLSPDRETDEEDGYRPGSTGGLADEGWTNSSPRPKSRATNNKARGKSRLATYDQGLDDETVDSASDREADSSDDEDAEAESDSEYRARESATRKKRSGARANRASSDKSTTGAGSNVAGRRRVDIMDLPAKSRR